MGLRITQNEIAGSRNVRPLIEQMEEADRSIEAAAQALALRGDIEWSGKPMSGIGEGAIAVDEGAIAVRHTLDASVQRWLLLHQEDGKVHRVYRVVELEDGPAVQELDTPDKAGDDIGAKYERDCLQGILEACLRNVS